MLKLQSQFALNNSNYLSQSFLNGDIVNLLPTNYFNYLGGFFISI